MTLVRSEAGARSARRNGQISFWFRQAGIAPPRPPLPGPRGADVCIVGAGFTGLWTAYYLKRARPELEVVVLEREFAGFGASGRNGGWVSDSFAGSREAMARSHGRDAVVALQRAMESTVDEVLEVCRAEGIDAGLIKPGMLRIARDTAQARRMEEQLEDDRGWGRGVQDIVALDSEHVAQHVRVAGAVAGLWTPHCARAQPARLVTGLAAAVERLGVTIYEDTVVSAIEPGRARTDRGDVTAPTVLCCLEGFTASIPSQRLALLPLNSAMVVTDPLDDERWERIGWQDAVLLGDNAHAYMYAQRTTDGRIALGGRGIPYRYGSRTDRWGVTQQRTIGQLIEILHSMFPAVADVAIDHAWCGVLGVRRDWIPAVEHDRATGLGVAGGYVGNGVAATNLAARVLRDLVLERDTPLTALPWVRHRPRRWEPEPLRWLGARLVYGLYRAADRRESAPGATAHDSRLATLAGWVSGRDD